MTGQLFKPAPVRLAGQRHSSSMPPARGIDAVDQLFGNWVGWRQRQEAGRPAEYDRVAKHTRPPQRQGDLRRVIVVDLRDGGERNKLNVSLPIS